MNTTFIKCFAGFNALPHYPFDYPTVRRFAPALHLSTYGSMPFCCVAETVPFRVDTLRNGAQI